MLPYLKSYGSIARLLSRPPRTAVRAPVVGQGNRMKLF
jgi:hypothetical protein